MDLLSGDSSVTPVPQHPQHARPADRQLATQSLACQMELFPRRGSKLVDIASIALERFTEQLRNPLLTRRGQASATGDVAEDDLVDQSLHGREVVGEDLVVVGGDA